LEKIPVTAVAAVEVHRVPGKQALHDDRCRCVPGSKQQVNNAIKKDLPLKWATPSAVPNEGRFTPTLFSAKEEVILIGY
jgi:hypothetical protein